MAKASPIQTSFNAGEFAPVSGGRVDIGKYANACSRMENMIPLIQGPARRRGGTRFINEVKTSANRTWLARFEFNTTQAYVLEFGNLYVRFYTNNGILESSPGVPVEVTTPWATADLITADGSFGLQMVQSGDVIYICHPNYAPRKLARTGATTWSISTLTVEGGPFDDYDPDETKTVYASSRTGIGVTITASSGIFASTDVGRLFYIEQKKANALSKWKTGTIFSTNNLCRSGGKTYKCLGSAVSGDTPPSHTQGSEFDGAPGIQWEFQDAGYGWAIITGYTSATVVTCTVLSDFPDQAVTSGNTTTRWAFGSWGSVPGYPSHVCFYKNRLCFARASDRKLWFSVAADYENFQDRDEGGLVTADMAITRTVESDQSNPIQYLITGQALIIGTSGGEHICKEMTTADPFGPDNVNIFSSSSYGSRGTGPVRVGESVLFVQRSGRKLREFSYDALKDGYGSTDMNVLAPHMAPKGTYFRQLAYQKEPHSIVWAILDDGTLRGFTFNREQYTEPPYGGWHRHDVSGEVESIVCVPSPDNDRDDLWMIVKRTIDGAVVRYIEYMQAEYEDGDDQEDAFYVDCGLTYDSTPATTISGLDHLEGEVVAILADGAVHAQRTVTSGAITLTRSASVAQIGLPNTCKLATMKAAAGAADGTAQGKTKRINRLVVRMVDTLGGGVGPTETDIDTIYFRDTGDLMDQATPIFSGDKEVGWQGGYEKDGCIWYVNDQPLPATIVAFMPQITTQDR